MLGANNPRVDRVRELHTKKGRRDQARFTIEGSTMLREALRSGLSIEELYGTAAELETSESAREAESKGAQLFRVDERTMRRLSGLETPPGLLAVAPMELCGVAELFAAPGLVLALAGLSDPGNAGTLLRTAEAFGVSAVVFGSGAVEPHSPKVVRGAMGSLFRMKIAQASPQETAGAAAGWEITGLASGGDPIEGLSWGPRSLLVVGQERRGLGPWTALCTRVAAIPMKGQAESLNAAVAGAIALYEASKRMQASP